MTDSTDDVDWYDGDDFFEENRCLVGKLNLLIATNTRLERELKEMRNEWESACERANLHQQLLGETQAENEKTNQAWNEMRSAWVSACGRTNLHQQLLREALAEINKLRNNPKI